MDHRRVRPGGGPGRGPAAARRGPPRRRAGGGGAAGAWFVAGGGLVPGGAAPNAWVAPPGGRIVPRHADVSILRGVTRATIFDVAEKLGLAVEERAFSVDEARAAAEAFISGATTVVMPVVAIDGAPIGAGTPGKVAASLRQAFFDVAEKMRA